MPPPEFFDRQPEDQDDIAVEDNDIFEESEAKRKKWTQDDDETDPSDRQQNNNNFFHLMWRATLREHKNKCVIEACRTCQLDESDSLTWDARFRYGNLASKYEGKNLKQILLDKQWPSNSPPNVSQNQPKAKSLSSAMTKLKRQIAHENNPIPEKLVAKESLETQILEIVWQALASKIVIFW